MSFSGDLDCRTEAPSASLLEDTKLSALVRLEGWDVIQWNLGRRERWASAILTEFNKAKGKALYLGKGNPKHRSGLGRVTDREQCWGERLGAVVDWEAQDKLGMCVCSPESQFWVDYERAGEGLTQKHGVTGWGESFKLVKAGLRLSVRKKFFPLWVVRHWNRLLRETVVAPRLEVLEGKLDGALSNMV